MICTRTNLQHLFYSDPFNFTFSQITNEILCIVWTYFTKVFKILKPLLFGTSPTP